VSFPAGALDPRRGGEFTPFPVNFEGNPDLQPEEGESVTVGFIWEPLFAPGLSMTLNGFRLRQTNFITNLGIDQLIGNEDLFPGHVVRAPPAVTDPPGFAGRILSLSLSPVNFGRLTVKGADLQLQYAFPRTAQGQFVSSVAGTYIDEYEIVLIPGAEPTNEVGHANEAGYPTRFKGNAGISWSGLGGWSASATARYLASYTDYDGTRQLPSQTRFDAQLGYRFGERSEVALLERLETTLGIINLTDEQGDFSNNFNNTVGYDPQQADLRGRFYYLSLKMKF
jgi:outer membrane receptor protein involved in Fe transport